LDSLDTTLPLATRILVSVASALSDFGPPIAGALCVLGLGAFVGRRALPSVAMLVDRILLRVPAIGNVIAKTEVARFAEVFSILFRSGCTVSDSLKQAGDVMENKALRADVKEAAQRLSGGLSLSAVLEGVMPPFALGVLRTGERSGHLAKSLDDIATVCDREASAKVDAFIGVLEPSFTLAIGGLLAWTVLAVLGPIYGSLSVLGGRM
jgi:type II secretory pathway component PulF